MSNGFGKTLPPGWARATLGTLGHYWNGRGFKKSEWRDEGRPIIRIQDLTGTRTKPNYFQGAVDDRQVVRDGDVLVSWAATLGVYVWRGPEAVLNQHIFKVESFVNKTFHRYLIAHVLDDLRAKTHGSGMVHITRSKFDETPVLLPPLAEQSRIVAAIEEQFSRLDAGVESLERARRNLKRMRAAVIDAAVSGTLGTSDSEVSGVGTAEDLLDETVGHAWRRYATPEDPRLPDLPKGWVYVRLAALLREPLRNGHSARASADSAGIRTLTLTAVTLGEFTLANTKLTVADPSKVKDLWLQPGDILIERSNTPELVGTARLFDGPRNFAIFPDLMIRVRIRPPISPRYIELVLQSSRARRYFRSVAQGIAGSMPKIDQTAVEQFWVPLPGEHSPIVEEADRQLSLLHELEGAVAASLRRTVSLRRALLDDAFQGRLARQNNSDEPATVLLERLRNRARREAVMAKGRR